MKLPKKLIKVSFILLTCNAFISCKKDNGDNASPAPVSCRITGVAASNGSTTENYAFSYNSDNKISAVKITGNAVLNKVFTYSANTIVVNTTNGSGAFSGKDSITTDNSGKPVNKRFYYNQAGTSWHNTVYEYNGDVLTKISEAYDGNTYPASYTVTTVDGNVVYYGNTGSNSTFQYYTDKAVRTGDYLDLNSSINYGVRIYPHKNLIKKIDNGAGTFTDISYEFDADGKITKVFTTSSFGTATTYVYQYQCN